MKLYARALSATEVAAVRDENDARYSELLGYSAIGNIADKSDQGYTYGSSSHVHAVTAVGPNSYTYDANGSMTGRNSDTYTWDTENHLTAATRESLTSAVYDGDGRRLKRVEDGYTAYYPNRLYVTRSLDGLVWSSYFFGGRQVGARIGSDVVTLHDEHTAPRP